MANEGRFLVEDFLGAIASQLDRTQDALALKAVNRPLTYAIKDFTMELKVFVDLDADGRVCFRSPGANEAGASSVHIGFTTITRPMIEENTVDLALTHGPSLAQAGLSEEERRRLEHIGVRTTAELARLKGSTGTTGISRVADIPVDRLKAALSFGRPQVRAVRPVAPRPPAARPPAPAPAQPPGSTGPAPRPATPPPGSTVPVPAPPPRATGPGPRPAAPPPPRATGPGSRPAAPPPPRATGPGPRPAAPVPRPAPPARPAVPRPAPRPAPRSGVAPPPPRRPGAPMPIRVGPATRRIEVVGQDLIGARGTPQFRLGGQPLAVAEADENRIVVELPEDGARAGTLEMDHGDGDVVTYELGSDSDVGYELGSDSDVGYELGSDSDVGYELGSDGEVGYELGSDDPWAPDPEPWA